MVSNARIESALRGSFVLFCSLLALSLVFVLPHGKLFTEQGFNWYVNAGQRNLLAPRIAYAIFCAALCLSALVLSRYQAKWAQSASGKTAFAYLILGSVIVFCAASIFAVIGEPAVVFASLLIAAIGYFAFGRLSVKVVGLLSFSVATIVFLCSVIPGLTSTPDLSAHFPQAIADIELHQAMSTTASVQLAKGAKLFEAVSARYGILWQSGLAAWTNLVQPLTVGDTVMFTRWLHTLFFALAAVSYFKFARCNPLPACLAILFIAPWMELRQSYFAFPQVGAWRYFGFAAVPLVVMLLERASVSARCILLGVAAGLSLLCDFASGAAVAAGLFVYVLFRKEEGALIRSLSFYFAGICGSVLVFISVFAALFGYVPSISSFFADFKNTVWEAAGGTAPDIPYPFDPLAIVILLHTAYAFVTLASRGLRSLTMRDALRLALCVVSLLWFLHYVNEPNTYALRASRVLYGFFLVDLVRVLWTSRKYSTIAKEPRWLLLLILAGVIVPAAVLSYQPAVEKAAAMLKNQSKKDRPRMLVSGVYLPEEVGIALIRKSAFIKNIGGDQPVFYLTADTSFVPILSGKISAVPISDPFGQLFFAKQSDRLIKAIVDSGAQRVYVDDPDCVTSKGAERRSCFAYLRVLLGRDYTLERTADCWQVWKRKID